MIVFPAPELVIVPAPVKELLELFGAMPPWIVTPPLTAPKLPSPEMLSVPPLTVVPPVYVFSTFDSSTVPPVTRNPPENPSAPLMVVEPLPPTVSPPVEVAVTGDAMVSPAADVVLLLTTPDTAPKFSVSPLMVGAAADAPTPTLIAPLTTVSTSVLFVFVSDTVPWSNDNELQVWLPLVVTLLRISTLLLAGVPPITIGPPPDVGIVSQIASVQLPFARVTHCVVCDCFARSPSGVTLSYSANCPLTVAFGASVSPAAGAVRNKLVVPVPPATRSKLSVPPLKLNALPVAVSCRLVVVASVLSSRTVLAAVTLTAPIVSVKLPVTAAGVT